MTLKNAMEIFSKKIQNRKIIGYWRTEEGYVFNTKSFESVRDLLEASQFVVTESGEVYGTNPMSSNLSEEEYVPVQNSRR